MTPDTPTLHLRLAVIGGQRAAGDFVVIDSGNIVGRIRHSAERTNDIWAWNVTIPIPGGVPCGHAGDLEAAKAAFRDAWLKFKVAAGPEALADAIGLQDKARNRGKTKVR